MRGAKLVSHELCLRVFALAAPIIAQTSEGRVSADTVVIIQMENAGVEARFPSETDR
jgi:hypothetical protein